VSKSTCSRFAEIGRRSCERVPNLPVRRYFTDRDDRYILFRDCPGFADYISALFASRAGLPAVCYSLAKPSGSGAWGAALPRRPALCTPHIGHDPVTAPISFSEAAATHMRQFQAAQRKKWLQSLRQSSTPQSDTWVVPSLQMAPHGIQQDEQLCAEVFADPTAMGSDAAVASDTAGVLTLSSAYLNLSRNGMGSSAWSLVAHALAKSPAQLTLVLPSDSSHGFHGATGLSRYIPAGYEAHIAICCIRATRNAAMRDLACRRC
jgi:CDP-diacylglycerol--glycerol-3-phosphate 3-phosphatidyltransferase